MSAVLAHPAGDRRARAALATTLLAVVLLGVALTSITIGAVRLPLGTVISAIFTPDLVSPRDETIIWAVRMPRTLLAILVGGALASGGVIMQGLFRNPLADPGFVGVSSGASVAAITVIVLGGPTLGTLGSTAMIHALPVAAFFGGLVSTICLYLIATRRGRTSVATMLLGGIAIGALAAAASGIMIYMSNDQQLRDFQFWTLGSLAGASWTKAVAILPFMGLSTLLAVLTAKGLNAMALGEREAHHLGIPAQYLKRVCIVSVALLTGAAVSVSGTIGFIGLVVPHILRLTIGPDHRYLIPAAAFLGAVLLMAADMVARTIVAPAELPIGIVTALAGAPFFIWVLLRNRSVVDL
jgi:iron complex transport system permease protein